MQTYKLVEVPYISMVEFMLAYRRYMSSVEKLHNLKIEVRCRVMKGFAEWEDIVVTPHNIENVYHRWFCGTDDLNTVWFNHSYLTKDADEMSRCLEANLRLKTEGIDRMKIYKGSNND